MRMMCRKSLQSLLAVTLSLPQHLCALLACCSCCAATTSAATSPACPAGQSARQSACHTSVQQCCCVPADETETATGCCQACCSELPRSRHNPLRLPLEFHATAFPTAVHFAHHSGDPTLTALQVSPDAASLLRRLAQLCVWRN